MGGRAEVGRATQPRRPTQAPLELVIRPSRLRSPGPPASHVLNAMPTLSTIWYEACADQAPSETSGQKFALASRNMEPPFGRLKAQGRATPPKANLRLLLSTEGCAEPERAADDGGRWNCVPRYTLHHFLELVGAPLWTFAAATCQGERPEWNQQLQKNLETWTAEWEGLLVSASQALDMETWLIELANAFRGHSSTEVPPDFLAEVASQVVPLSLPPTKAVSELLAANAMAEQVVGGALSAHCRQNALQTLADMPLAAGAAGPTGADLDKQVHAALVQALRRSWRPGQGSPLTGERAETAEAPQEPPPRKRPGRRPSRHSSGTKRIKLGSPW